MLNSVKRLFNFQFWTHLPLDVCRGRLTAEYLDLLIKQGAIKTKILDWNFGFEAQKDGRTKMMVIWYRICMFYNISLKANSEGTLVTCRHFPFNLSGLFLPALISLICFLGFISFLVNGNISGAIGAIVFSAVSAAICVMYEHFARKPLKLYLFKFLECIPLNNNFNKDISMISNADHSLDQQSVSQDFQPHNVYATKKHEE